MLGNGIVSRKSEVWRREDKLLRNKALFQVERRRLQGDILGGSFRYIGEFTSHGYDGYLMQIITTP